TTGTHATVPETELADEGSSMTNGVAPGAESVGTSRRSMSSWLSSVSGSTVTLAVADGGYGATTCGAAWTRVPPPQTTVLPSTVWIVASGWSLTTRSANS